MDAKMLGRVHDCMDAFGFIREQCLDKEDRWAYLVALGVVFREVHDGLGEAGMGELHQAIEEVRAVANPGGLRQ